VIQVRLETQDTTNAQLNEPVQLPIPNQGVDLVIVNLLLKVTMNSDEILFVRFALGKRLWFIGYWKQMRMLQMQPDPFSKLFPGFVSMQFQRQLRVR